MMVGTLYNEMEKRGLTTSMRSWSEEWAGRSHNFASTHWSKDLPPEALLRVRSRLVKLGYPDLAATLLLALIGDLPPVDVQSVEREAWYAE
jgi:hypothetical protein